MFYRENTVDKTILMEKFDIRYFMPNQFPSTFWLESTSSTQVGYAYSLSRKEVKFYCEGFGAILCKLIVLCVAFVSVREKEKPTV